jgi:D-alanyl-D-alanine carboxypeptidase
LAARPGYSEHQTGLAVDFAARGVSTLQVSFAKTKAGIWLAANAYRYGFVLRYPSGKTAITGYSFEPWHFRYVGVEVATAMHDQNIQTLEEFYALPAAPSYLN